jgi:hypothetical protein
VSDRPAVHARAPRALACAATLALLRLALRTAGLKRTVAAARRLGGDRAPIGSDPEELVRTTTRRIAAAAAFFPGRAECLEQSLALFVLLRRRGVPVELRIGVQRYPFLAHAWVEHEGRPINEREEFVAQLTPFPSVGA